MKIEIVEFVEGARLARGVAVIIDVFRAFSVECYAANKGVSQIIATAEIKEAFRLKTLYKTSVLAGERDERKIPGFDFGNSPTEIIPSNLTGKTFIHTTTAGTQGLVNAQNADVVLTGSFVNAGAIVRYINKLNPELVYLVAMGYRATESSDEDLLCARLIAERLNGRETITQNEISELKNTSGKRFFVKENFDFSPPTDFFLCTMTDRFDFVLKAQKMNDGNVAIARIDV